MKWYLKVYDRPFGIETTLFTTYNKPEIIQEVEIRTNEEFVNPFGWEVIEFSTLKDVLTYCINYMNKDLFIEFILNNWPTFIFEKHENK